MKTEKVSGDQVIRLIAHSQGVQRFAEETRLEKFWILILGLYGIDVTCASKPVFLNFEYNLKVFKVFDCET